MAAVSGPKFAPHSMQRIFEKLENRLNSLHYDTHYLKQYVERVQAPIHRKFDKFFDAKINFSNTANNSQFERYNKTGSKAFRLKHTHRSLE